MAAQTESMNTPIQDYQKYTIMLRRPPYVDDYPMAEHAERYGNTPIQSCIKNMIVAELASKLQWFSHFRAC